MRHQDVVTTADDPNDDRLQGSHWNKDHALGDDENFVTDAELLVLADAVTSSAVIADHAIVRGDLGAKGVQDSGVLIDDNDLVFVPGTDSDFTTGLHVVDVAGQLGAYHTNYGIESYSTDANGAWAASDGDLYFNYYSSGDIFFGDGGGDLFSSGDFWLTTTSQTFYFGSSAYKLQIDGSNNLSFTDAVTGTKTLAELAAVGGTLEEGENLILGTTTGTKIGTATSQKLSLWNSTPIVQPTTAHAEAAFTENSGGTAVNVDSTFGGYTLQQIVQALQDIGALA